MRGRALRCVVPMFLLAAVAFAQAPAPQAAAPTPTPTPQQGKPAATTATRVVAPSAEPWLDDSEPLPMSPIGAVPASPKPGVPAMPSKNEFVLAPIPISDPAVGSGLGLTAVYTFAKDDPNDPSPPPTVGAGGFYTSNDSWSGAAMAKLYLKRDRYRVAFGGAVGSLNYDLFAAGADRESIPISQEFEAAVGQFLVGLGKRWYAGLRVTWVATDVSRQDDETAPIPIPRGDLDSTLVELGLRIERDSRDNIFYPTAGSRLQLFANHNDTGFGSDYTYTKSWLIYAKYLSLSEPVVLAIEGAGCYASEGGPFYSLCMFGTKNLLRGYTVGQYLDRWTVSTQAEARWRFAHRWIATGFAGVGVVEPARTITDDGADSLPAAGVGLHWIAAPENLITVRAEYAIGEGGVHGFYVAIGQAF